MYDIELCAVVGLVLQFDALQVSMLLTLPGQDKQNDDESLSIMKETTNGANEFHLKYYVLKMH